MKKITGFFLILILGNVSWGDLESTAPAPDSGASQPVVHKKVKKAATSTAKIPLNPPLATRPVFNGSVASLPRETGREAKGEVKGDLPLTALQQIVTTTLPANPVINALDQWVLNDTSPHPPSGHPLPPGEGEPPQAVGEAPAPSNTLRGALYQALSHPHEPLNVELLGGGQMLMAEGHTLSQPAVGIRFHCVSPWSYEIGATIPQDTTGAFRTASTVIDGTTYAAHIQSMFELHVAADYSQTFGDVDWFVPHAGFGVSMMAVHNLITSAGTASFQYSGQTYYYQTDGPIGDPVNYSFSPLFRLGFALFPEHLVSLRFDAAYVGYANTVSANGQTFDLGFAGWQLNPMLQVRF